MGGRGVVSLLSTVENEPFFVVQEAGEQVCCLSPIPQAVLGGDLCHCTALCRAGGVTQWWNGTCKALAGLLASDTYTELCTRSGVDLRFPREWKNSGLNLPVPHSSLVTLISQHYLFYLVLGKIAAS